MRRVRAGWKRRVDFQLQAVSQRVGRRGCALGEPGPGQQDEGQRLRGGADGAALSERRFPLAVVGGRRVGVNTVAGRRIGVADVLCAAGAVGIAAPLDSSAASTLFCFRRCPLF